MPDLGWRDPFTEPLALVHDAKPRIPRVVPPQPEGVSDHQLARRNSARIAEQLRAYKDEDCRRRAKAKRRGYPFGDPDADLLARLHALGRAAHPDA